MVLTRIVASLVRSKVGFSPLICKIGLLIGNLMEPDSCGSGGCLPLLCRAPGKHWLLVLPVPRVDCCVLEFGWWCRDKDKTVYLRHFSHWRLDNGMFLVHHTD